MAYLDKWLSVFPKIVGQETRPENGIDDTLEFNTDGFPQRIASDPVRYDLENAMGSQLFSNDKRLKEITDQLKQQAGAHEKDPRAHSTGIAGNAATATKLNTARTIAISGKVTGAATAFDGSKNISINTTAVTADNCTGNSATATNATNDSYGQNIRSTYIKALSCSGTRITYTRGDNTTGYFYTQDTNTTYNDFSGAGSYYGGSHGLVPAPSSGYQDRFLAGSGDWEAFSAAYQAMQSLSPSSDKIPYFTGSASAALATLTSFARSILDDTSAEAVRGTIGANAQNCGGIVAASLTQNGYVKFANGLIIQWGMQGAGNNWDVYYPITVATILALVAIDAGATASDELQAIGVNPSVTSFKTYSSSGNDFKLSWVAICKS